MNLNSPYMHWIIWNQIRFKCHLHIGKDTATMKKIKWSTANSATQQKTFEDNQMEDKSELVFIKTIQSEIKNGRVDEKMTQWSIQKPCSKLKVSQNSIVAKGAITLVQREWNFEHDRYDLNGSLKFRALYLLELIYLRQIQYGKNLWKTIKYQRIKMLISVWFFFIYNDIKKASSELPVIFTDTMSMEQWKWFLFEKIW